MRRGRTTVLWAVSEILGPEPFWMAKLNLQVFDGGLAAGSGRVRAVFASLGLDALKLREALCGEEARKIH